jgi:phosphate transport system substrate-binding protein
MCQGQQQSASLGYSPMPINLVEASFDQIRKIPGVVVQDIDIAKCKNPTFSADGTNLLASSAAMPPECDRKGPSQCATGTGGDKDQATAVKPAAAGGAATGDARAAGPVTASGGGGTTGAPAARNAGPSAPGPASAEVVDPELGAVAESDPTLTEVSASGTTRSEAALATTTTLAGSSGWSASQTLMVLVVVLLLALIIGPAYLWRALAGRGQP